MPPNGNYRISIQAKPDDLAQIDEVMLSAPLASRHRVARAAMRLGLAKMLEEPAKIVETLKSEGGAR